MLTWALLWDRTANHKARPGLSGRLQVVLLPPRSSGMFIGIKKYSVPHKTKFKVFDIQSKITKYQMAGKHNP